MADRDERARHERSIKSGARVNGGRAALSFRLIHDSRSLTSRFTSSCRFIVAFRVSPLRDPLFAIAKASIRSINGRFRARHEFSPRRRFPRRFIARRSRMRFPALPRARRAHALQPRLSQPDLNAKSIWGRACTRVRLFSRAFAPLHFLALVAFNRPGHLSPFGSNGV